MAQQALRGNVVLDINLNFLGKPWSMAIKKDYKEGRSLDKKMETADEELVRRCQQGDKEAFGVLVGRHQNRIYRLVCYTLGKADGAEDLAQEAFLRAYQSIRGFRFKANFFTWLYRIAVNLCLREIRRKKFFHPLEDGGSTPSGNEDALGRIEKEEDLKHLYRCLDRLKDKEKMVLVLREIEELSYEEIGIIMDYPLGTVKSALSRAREKLRHHMTGEAL